MKIENINGVEIITDDNGNQHFHVSNETQKDTRSWWQKFKDWISGNVTPYAKIRDLADPFDERKNDPDDIDAGSDGKNGAEIGIKINF